MQVCQEGSRRKFPGTGGSCGALWHKSRRHRVCSWRVFSRRQERTAPVGPGTPCLRTRHQFQFKWRPTPRHIVRELPKRGHTLETAIVSAVPSHTASAVGGFGVCLERAAPLVSADGRRTAASFESERVARVMGPLARCSQCRRSGGRRRHTLFADWQAVSADL